MTTATPRPIIHVFKEINEGKYKSVKHYELIEVKNGTTQLSNLINISKDRNCAQSLPTYWLKERNGKNWKKHCTTGLFKTGIANIYKGDLNRKKHLIIFDFSEGANILTVFLFHNYYTIDLSNVLHLLTNYYDKKRGCSKPSLIVQMLGNTATHNL